MGRPLTYVISLALAVCAAATLTACGGEDAALLPGRTAAEITANLDTVKRLAAEGDCIGARSAAQQVAEQIEAIEGIDPKLKRALREGAARLNEVVSECEEATTESTTPQETAPESEQAPEKPKKEKGPKAPKEKPKEGEGPPSTPPGPPEETPAEPEPPATPPGQEEEGGEGPSGGVGPGSPLEEGD